MNNPTILPIASEVLKTERGRLDRFGIAERVTEVLREQITGGLFAPGARLSEESISEALGISRNTLREAFRLLQHEGLVVHELNRGVFIRVLDAVDVTDLYQLRQIVEVSALELTALQPAVDLDQLIGVVELAESAAAVGNWSEVATLDLQFHYELVALAGNPRLNQLMQQLMAELRLAFHAISRASEFHYPYLARNREMVTLLQARQFVQTAHELRTYLRDALSELMRAFAPEPDIQAVPEIKLAPQLSKPQSVEPSHKIGSSVNMGQTLTLHSAGPHALLVEFEDIQQVRNYYAEAQRRLFERRLPAGIELVPAACTLLFDGIEDVAALARDLRTWRPIPDTIKKSRQLKLPTIYDGPDLPEVAELWGMTVPQVIQMHADLVHEVAFIGFAPGFAYISGIPAALRVPRRSRPRPRVAAGSVALADQFSGVYPRESPGGWQLIGRTTESMWNPNSDPASYFMPGDQVRFVPITP